MPARSVRGGSTAKRAESLPNVPTVIESGVPATRWCTGTHLHPGGTPKEIAGQLFAEIERALRAQDVVANLAKQGATTGAVSQNQFADS